MELEKIIYLLSFYAAEQSKKLLKEMENAQI
jgi:hypothetical protein